MAAPAGVVAAAVVLLVLRPVAAAVVLLAVLPVRALLVAVLPVTTL